MYSQAELLKLIDAAIKGGGITDVDNLGQSVLQPSKLTRFIKQAQLATVVLPQARYTQMTSHVADIDRIAFLGRVLHAGTTLDDGKEVHSEVSQNKWARPKTYTNKLTAKEFVAIASIRDSSLRRNLEGENFNDTLVDLLGQAAGRDLEEYAFFANTDISYGDDDLLCKTDGWIKKAENKIYGVGAGKDFDPASDNYPENMFNEMMSATPKQYLADINRFRFWVDWDTRDKYLELVKKRGTALGDSIYDGNLPPYKGIRVEYVPLFERSYGDKGGAGKVCVLGYPDNHAWGVFHRVVIEPEREAKHRRTDFVLTIEADAGFEDENACTVAYIEKDADLS